MEPEVLRSVLKKAADLGCHSFHIGGGESFLNLEGLYKVLEVMKEEGVKVEYVETNASWYRDIASSELIIENLQKRGCTSLMISVCPFHNEFVPLAQMEGVMDACKRMGMEFFIWQEQYYRHLAALDKNKTHTFDELSEVWGRSYFLKTGKRFGLTMKGRALESYRNYLPHRPLDDILEENQRPCSELDKTEHFHLDLEGNYIPPACVGFTIDHKDLGIKLSKENYPHITTLNKEGIGIFLKEAQEKGFTPRKEGYVSKCDICEDIRYYYMSQGLAPEVKDLGPKEYYRRD